jgi:quercetin dioxygenase-like cupin family protein
MEIKRNEATANRPQGDRVIDAPYVFIDLPTFIDQITREKAWEKNDRNGITVFKANNITMVITAMQEGAKIDDNSVDAFLTLQVLGGKTRVTAPDGDIEMHKNQVISFHPGVRHSVEALSDVILLLTTFNSR